MCGIAGVLLKAGSFNVGSGPAEEADSQLEKITERMLAQVEHRGPDDQGMMTCRNDQTAVALGHRRLSIIDLSVSGHQPMRSDDERFWLTYNGEVYNYQEIRHELNIDVWRSHTDTEVLLRAYERWGAGCLQRLRGMFAFGLWDSREQELILARDAFGIKPLYYYAAPDEFIFASEVRALLATGLVPRKLSTEGVTSYLQSGSVASPFTLIEGVRSLQPRHYLTVKVDLDQLVVSETAYGPALCESAADTPLKDRREAVDLLRTTLEESIRLHLVSDVPLAAFLSGGIDSSAIVALMSKVTDDRPKTFSIGFAEREFNESSYARLIAERYGADHHEVFLSESDLLNMLPGALASMDQPTMDGVNSYVISRAVKQAGITVALSGLGGDELFAGYPSFHRQRRLQKMKGIPRSLRTAAASVGRTVLGASVHHRKAWDLLAGGATATHTYTVSRRLFSEEEIAGLLGKNATQAERLAQRSCSAEVERRDPLNAISLYELQGYMANTLLRDTDQMSMAHSLEVRVPFVDLVVAPFVLSLPGKWKMDGVRPKPLLLDALGDLLPEEVWRRPKMGFTLPFEKWMRSALTTQLDAAFLPQGGLDRLGISKSAADIWQTFKNTPHRERWSRPWALYVLNRWCEMNSVSL